MAVGSGVGVAVGSGVGVAVGSGVGVAVGSGIGVAVGSGIGVAVGSGVGVTVGSGVGVGAIVASTPAWTVALMSSVESGVAGASPPHAIISTSVRLLINTKATAGFIFSFNPLLVAGLYYKVGCFTVKAVDARPPCVDTPQSPHLQSTTT